MSKTDFRPFIPTKEESWVAGETVAEHSAARIKSDRAQSLFGGWHELFNQPYNGMTTDGAVIPDLYELRGQEAPVRAYGITV